MIVWAVIGEGYCSIADVNQGIVSLDDISRAYAFMQYKSDQERMEYEKKG